MQHGTTKTGKIHVFTDNNECLCDLNIKIERQVSLEYIRFIPFDKICNNCYDKLKNIDFFTLKEN
jgi:hypothetical protein